MTKTERMLDIWLSVVKNRSFTTRELAEKYDVSTRTIIRDLEQLSLMGVPLYTERGKGGGYRVLSSIALPPISFSEEELQSILFAYQMLEAVGENPFQIEIRSVREKLATQMSHYIQKETEQIQNHIDFLYPKRKVSCAFLRQLYLGAKNRQTFTIAYSGAKGEENLTIHPIGVYTWEGFWYCVAQRKNDTSYRIFRVDRVLSLKEAPDQTIPEGLWNLSQWEEQGFQNDSTVTVELELTTAAQRSILNIWMKQGEETAIAPDRVRLVFTCPQRQLPFVQADILKLGSEAVVLQPTSLKEEIRATVEEMAANYH